MTLTKTVTAKRWDEYIEQHSYLLTESTRSVLAQIGSLDFFIRRCLCWRIGIGEGSIKKGQMGWMGWMKSGLSQDMLVCLVLWDKNKGVGPILGGEVFAL